VRAAHARTSGTCSRLPADSGSELVRIGRVGRPHGVDGAFVVEEASEDPRRFEVGAELRVDGEPARVTLSRQVGGRRRAIKLERPVERGAELSVRRQDLAPLPEDAFYVSDLIGLEVLDERGDVVGVVRDVHHGPANDALELETGLLLPLVEDCIREVDVDGGRVLLNPGFTE
jgi:16S rRNA processing protein RimM